MQFFVTDEVDRIDLGDGYWVDIKRAMSYADVERGAVMTDGKQPSGVPLLEANVVAWNLPGPDGKVPPVGREALEKLSPVWAARLLEEVLKRNPFLTLVQTPPGSGKPSEV